MLIAAFSVHWRSALMRSCAIARSASCRWARGSLRPCCSCSEWRRCYWRRCIRLTSLALDLQTGRPYLTNTTSAADAFSLVRQNCAGDNSARAGARRFAGMESPLGAAGPRQGTGTPRAPARASIGISDPADSSGRSAIPTTAVTEPTAAARSPAESATGSARPPARLRASSAGPPAGPAAGSVRLATKAAGAGHHSALRSAAAKGGARANPTPLLGQPADDGSGPGHRAGGRPGRRGQC